MVYIIIGIVVIAIIYFVVFGLKEKLGSDSLEDRGFITTRSAGALRIDDKNRKWSLVGIGLGSRIYDFSEMMDCAIHEVSTVKTTIKRLGVYIYTTDGQSLYISLLESETSRSSLVGSSSYELAHRIEALGKSIISSR